MNAEITTPCSENWNRMSICGKGRFCGKCALTVIDAEKLSDEELMEEAAGKEKICVRIRPTRVKTKSRRVYYISRLELFLNARNLKKMAALLTAVLLFASCCRQRILGGWANCNIQNDRLHPQHEYPTGKIGVKEGAIDPMPEENSETEKH